MALNPARDDTPRGAYPPQSVPQQRIVEKLDEYMSRRDYEGAQRHLLYWLEEARVCGDKRGQLMVHNELVGHFRKTGDAQQALHHADAALQLVDELDFGDTISAGTTYINAGTACNAFGRDERALRLFEKAALLYEQNEHTDARLLGGLYNNMALTCVSLERFQQADELYDCALHAMQQVEHGQLEQAITYLNRADALVAYTRIQAGLQADEPLVNEDCERQVAAYLDTAWELLNTPTVPRDGYYAFVCEKCAPTFAHYGYFLVDKELRERAQALYEGA